MKWMSSMDTDKWTESRRKEWKQKREEESKKKTKKKLSQHNKRSIAAAPATVIEMERKRCRHRCEKEASETMTQLRMKKFSTAMDLSRWI